MIAAETSWSEVANTIWLGAPGMVAAFFAYKASMHAVKAHKGVENQAPVIQAIDNAVNGRGPGEPTMSQDIAVSRDRDDVADAAVSEIGGEETPGAADRAAGATATPAAVPPTEDEPTKENP